MTILYIHGYGSTGNALKGQMLRRMLPEHKVVSPTFDYDHLAPRQIQEQIRQTIEHEGVGMVVGSSFGGYQTLCATAFFHGPVWVINPVHDVEATIRRVIMKTGGIDDTGLQRYREFDREVFRRQSSLNRAGQWPADTPLYFALSTDDELLGDHHVLLDLFPDHRRVVWKDNSGHRFLRFDELAPDLSAAISATVL